MHIILNFIRILLAIVAAGVLASYAVRQYELGNRADGAPESGDGLSLAEAVLGIALEIGAVFVSILLYPIGFIMRDTALSSLRHGERPIILCHGYMHNRSGFLLMGHRLKRAGRNNVIALNFGPTSEGVPYFAERLSETVKGALVHTGCDKVDLVGHSMGGLVVRYFVERLDGASCVNAAVTLGAPHFGTKTAALGIFKSAEQFRPDSTLIAELGRSAGESDAADMTAVWSDFDSVILPHENACLAEPSANVKIGGVGHVALLFSGRVFNEVRRAVSKDPLQRDSADGVT